MKLMIVSGDGDWAERFTVVLRKVAREMGHEVYGKEGDPNLVDLVVIHFPSIGSVASMAGRTETSIVATHPIMAPTTFFYNTVIKEGASKFLAIPLDHKKAIVKIVKEASN